jgi:peptidoglycan/xylan/chitin deacetylase (PgdA/CDA1 family)
MLAALRAAGVGSVTGFVNGGAIAGDPASEAVLPAWRAAGFPLGNHTWTHANLNALSDIDYEAEIARDEPLLERLAGGADWRWFRYPFLAEGDDPARRATIRRYLADRHYRIAAVTMDFADYGWNPPYARCAAKGDGAAVARLERSYLDAALEGMNGARTLSRALYGRDIPYVLLMHIGAFDARMMPRLLALFRAQGFRFVPLAEAERDPAYAQDVDPSQPAGPTGLVARAKARGIAVPPLYTRVAALDSICR